MKQVTLQAQRREAKGKGGARQLRRQGFLPAIMYGRHVEPTPLQISERDFYRLLQAAGRNVLVRLSIDGAEPQEQLTIIKEIQREPVTRTLLHVDFQAISPQEPIRTTVPVELVGHPVGVTAGGILQHRLRQVEIECLPLEIPDRIQVDISSLNVGETLTLAQVPLPEGVKVLTHLEEPVAHILVPRLLRAGEAKEAEAEAAPTEEEEAKAEEEGGAAEAEEKETE